MKKNRFCFLIHLPQDLDLLVPIIEKTKKSGNPVICLVYKNVLHKSPRLTHYLNTTKTPWKTIGSHRQDLLLALWYILRSSIIISAVETSEPPHRFAYILTRIANFFGKATITMQHGLENIGLTYSDASYPIDKVRFASKKILLWGDISELHPNVTLETKRKCLPFGCTKQFLASPPLPKPAPYVVGVFENLHWSRYNDHFRQQFISDFIHAAESLPEITFFIKPHHEGRWLTERSKQSLTLPQNIFIIDPKNPKWEPYTGPSIVALSDLVITTPSTIALDAAIQNIPTCVVGYDLDAQRYSPLPIIKNSTDWRDYILAARQHTYDYSSSNRHFVSKTLYRQNCLEHLNEVL